MTRLCWKALADTYIQVSRKENIVGWYHSHPGYGCWLSGIDVSTQMLQQSFSEPFLAVVIDPNRTISAGKVDIGAFRTYPEVSPVSPRKSNEELVLYSYDVSSTSRITRPLMRRLPSISQYRLTRLKTLVSMHLDTILWTSPSSSRV